MKIELKNVKDFPDMSEETTAFVADIYVDGVKVAYAKNDGHGGCTDYNAHEGKRELLKQAEQYCISLPKKNYGTFSLDMNLEHLIDELLYEELKNKDNKKFQNKQARLMETSILVGVPGAGSFGQYNYKRPLATIPKETLQKFVDNIKGKLKEGEQILNTNLEALGINV